MSIIYEALKKTQNSPKNITVDAALNAGQKQNLRKAGNVPYALASLIIIGLGFIFYIFLGKPQKLEKISIIHKPQVKKSISQPPPLDDLASSSPPISSSSSLLVQDVPNEEKKPRRPQPEFVVNGIVISLDGNIALINDQIIRVGDDIEGARVERIEDSRVVLSYEGREIVLKSK